MANVISQVKLPNNTIYDIYGKNVENIEWSDYEDLTTEQKNADIAYFITDVPAEEQKNGVIGEVPNLPQAIATFKDGADAPMKSLKVAIEPQQDLHGYDAPWAGGAGKNKLPNSSTDSRSVSGIQIYNDKNGKYTISGTATANTFIDFELTDSYVIKSGDYIHLMNSAANSNASFTLMDGTTVGFSAVLSSTNRILDLSNYVGSTVNKIRFYFNANQGMTGTMTPMIVNSNIATTFAPYSNICPIEGWDDVNVTRTGKNLFSYDLPIRDGYWASATVFQGSNNIVTKENAITWQYIRLYVEGLSQITLSGFDMQGGTLCAWLGSEDVNDVITTFNSAEKNGTKTVPQGAKYICLVIYSIKTKSESYPNAQLEIGSSSTTYEPYAGTTYTIDLDGTRYGGELDVVNGVLTVDRVGVDMGSLSWANRNNNIFSTKLNDAPQDNSFSVICERYKTNNVNAGTLATLDYTLSTYPSYDYKTVMIRDSNYSTDTDFKNSLDGVKMVYELTTPLTIQLTPTQVKSLLGSNNVWADTGDIKDVEYIKNSNYQLRMNDMVIAGGNIIGYAVTARLAEYANKAGSVDWLNINNKPTIIGTVTQVKVGSTTYDPTSGVISLPAYPSVPVTSVAGKTGAVTLTASDVGALASTTKYAGSSTAGGAATSAAKLTNTSKIGDTNKPVYFTANGVPTAISYTIEKSVPSDAVFTDTDHTYNLTSTDGSLEITSGTSGNNTIWDVSVVKVNGHTVNKDVPSTAVFTDTNNAVTQTADTSTNKYYDLIFSGSEYHNTYTGGTRKSSDLMYNPYLKNLSLYGSMYINDKLTIGDPKTTNVMGLSFTTNPTGGGVNLEIAGGSNSNTYYCPYVWVRENKTDSDKSMSMSPYDIEFWNYDGGSPDTWDGVNSSLKTAFEHTPYVDTLGTYPWLKAPGNTNNWIRIGADDGNERYGIIPASSGNLGSGHGSIGTATWVWDSAYIDKINCKSVNGIRIHGGTWVKTVTASGTHAFCTNANMNSWFGVTNCSNGNCVLYVMNGDDGAQSGKDIDSTYYNNGTWYVRFRATPSAGAYRFNYVVIYFG